MKKIRFDVYNDGILYVGTNEIIKDLEGNEISKSFTSNGRLFFSYSNIRESDRMNFDEDLKIDLKVKVRFNNLIHSNNIVKLNEKLYSITKIDRNKNNLFLYLNDYTDELDKQIEIYSVNKISALQDAQVLLFRKVFANVDNLESVINPEKEIADSIVSKKKLKIKIKYIKELDKKDSSLRFKIKFKNDFYNILQVIDKSENEKNIEIEVVRE